MNEILSYILAGCQIIFPIISGFALFVMRSEKEKFLKLEKRIDELEGVNEALTEKKLDKETYFRDQGAMQKTLDMVQGDIKDVRNIVVNMPEKIIAILNNTGKI